MAIQQTRHGLTINKAAAVAPDGRSVLAELKADGFRTRYMDGTWSEWLPRNKRWYIGAMQVNHEEERGVFTDPTGAQEFRITQMGTEVLPGE